MGLSDWVREHKVAAVVIALAVVIAFVVLIVLATSSEYLGNPKTSRKYISVPDVLKILLGKWKSDTGEMIVFESSIAPLEKTKLLYGTSSKKYTHLELLNKAINYAKSKGFYRTDANMTVDKTIQSIIGIKTTSVPLGVFYSIADPVDFGIRGNDGTFKSRSCIVQGSYLDWNNDLNTTVSCNGTSFRVKISGNKMFLSGADCMDPSKTCTSYQATRM
jgi:hypothetical protein